MQRISKVIDSEGLVQRKIAGDQPPTSTRGAHVEIIDPTGADQRVLVPMRVRVNGVDVGLIAENGVKIEAGGVTDGATMVTLVLLASHVEILGEDSASD